MTITKYNPSNGTRSELLSPWNFNSFLQSFFNDELHTERGINFFQPEVDMVEHGDSFELTLTLPGVKKSDVTVDVKENTLRISGKREERKMNEDSVWHQSEIVKGAFSRTFHLPKNVNKDKIEAKMEEGMLTISIPKGEEMKPKAIKVL
jgi:HSP20 family protein